MSQHTTSFCCLVKKMSVDKNVNSLFIKIETIKKMRKKYIRSLDNYSIDNYSNAYCKKPYFIRNKNNVERKLFCPFYKYNSTTANIFKHLRTVKYPIQDTYFLLLPF